MDWNLLTQKHYAEIETSQDAKEFAIRLDKAATPPIGATVVAVLPVEKYTSLVAEEILPVEEAL